MSRLKLFFSEKLQHKKFRLVFFLACFLILYIFRGIYVWLNSESTDNAYLQSNITFISPEVRGVVEEIHFVENQKVAKGDLMLKIKDIDYEAQYNKAKVVLVRTELGISSANSSYKMAEIESNKTEESLVLGKLNLLFAQKEFTRATKLTADNFSSKKLLDNANLALQKAQTKLNQSMLSSDSAKENIILLAAKKRDSEEKYKAATADLVIAKNNYENTKITAPIDGVVTSNSARVGGYVNAGSPIFAIVPIKNYYIKANFKETQISKFKEGMKATVKLDGIKGKEFTGRIRNLYPATGANFSLIPTDSATGNFTKIVQRIPVIIDVEIPDQYQSKIAIGYSAYVHIRVDQ